MHLGVVLGDLDPAVGLALDEEKRELKFLGRMGRGLVDVKITALII